MIANCNLVLLLSSALPVLIRSLGKQLLLLLLLMMMLLTALQHPTIL